MAGQHIWKVGGCLPRRTKSWGWGTSKILELVGLRKNQWKEVVSEGQSNLDATPMVANSDEVAEENEDGYDDTVVNVTGSISVAKTVGTNELACGKLLEAEMKNAALTLQRLTQQGNFDDDLERKFKLLQYIRECAQTMKSLA